MPPSESGHTWNIPRRRNIVWSRGGEWSNVTAYQEFWCGRDKTTESQSWEWSQFNIAAVCVTQLDNKRYWWTEHISFGYHSYQRGCTNNLMKSYLWGVIIQEWIKVNGEGGITQRNKNVIVIQIADISD